MSERSERSRRAMEEALGEAGESGGRTPEDSSGEKRRQKAPRQAPGPESPWGMILAGALMAFLGGATMGIDGQGFRFFGAVLIGLGGIISMVGTVAQGVRLGMRWHRYESGKW